MFVGIFNIIYEKVGKFWNPVFLMVSHLKFLLGFLVSARFPRTCSRRFCECMKNCMLILLKLQGHKPGGAVADFQEKSGRNKFNCILYVDTSSNFPTANSGLSGIQFA